MNWGSFHFTLLDLFIFGYTTPVLNSVLEPDKCQLELISLSIIIFWAFIIFFHQSIDLMNHYWWETKLLCDGYPHLDFNFVIS